MAWYDGHPRVRKDGMIAILDTSTVDGSTTSGLAYAR